MIYVSGLPQAQNRYAPCNCPQEAPTLELCFSLSRVSPSIPPWCLRLIQASTINIDSLHRLLSKKIYRASSTQSMSGESSKRFCIEGWPRYTRASSHIISRILILRISFVFKVQEAYGCCCRCCALCIPSKNEAQQCYPGSVGGQ